MLIQEMLDKEESKDLGYDLKDDMMFFMNNDPDFYRKEYFPTMLKFKKYCKENKKVRPVAFQKMVEKAYSIYKEKFPVEGLEESLDKETCESLCNYIHETETKNIQEGHYD